MREALSNAFGLIPTGLNPSAHSTGSPLVGRSSTSTVCSTPSSLCQLTFAISVEHGHLFGLMCNHSPGYRRSPGVPAGPARHFLDHPELHELVRARRHDVDGPVQVVR